MNTIYKITDKKYYDCKSGNYIYKINSKWTVIQENTGQIFYKANTLKQCKQFQISKNETTSWNKFLKNKI